ncbi:MAG: hypothetical protein ACT4QE_18275 [Anaerolineales bacterium]
MKAPHEFESKAELLRVIGKKANTLRKWPYLKVGSLAKIIDKAVEQNTYRGLRDFAPGPKHVFTSWALFQLGGVAEKQLSSLQGQTDYDEWLESWAADLRAYWSTTQTTLKGIKYGQSRKLTNLLMKSYVAWDGLDADRRAGLLRLIHVPLDEFVLVGIRQCIREFPHYSVHIPTHPTMSSIKSSDMYRNIQLALREIAGVAKILPIHLDVFFWNLNHQD